MMSNTLNAVPATVLETMAERLQGQAEPIKIRSNDDHAALAADVLWKFARKTGLNRESESVQTGFSGKSAAPLRTVRAGRGWH